MDDVDVYTPLVMSKQLLQMAIEIVDLPMKHGDFTRVSLLTRE